MSLPKVVQLYPSWSFFLYKPPNYKDHKIKVAAFFKNFFIMIVCLETNTWQPPVHSKTPQHLGSSRFSEGVHVAHLCSFLCCVFVLCLSQYCTVCPMMTLSLNLPFLISASVFSNVYLSIYISSNPKTLLMTVVYVFYICSK